MYIYENIAFRPIEEEDLQILKKLHNDPSTLLQMGTTELVSSFDQKEWWQKGLIKEKDKRFAIVMSKTSEVIGRLRIQNIDQQNKNCEIGLDILSSRRGKGYGNKSYRMVLEFLFHHYNMHLIYLKVGDFNPGAKKLYEDLGFSETGKFPEYLYRHGRYWDYVIMSILREKYFQLYPLKGEKK